MAHGAGTGGARSESWAGLMQEGTVHSSFPFQRKCFQCRGSEFSVKIPLLWSGWAG